MILAKSGMKQEDLIGHSVQSMGMETLEGQKTRMVRTRPARAVRMRSVSDAVDEGADVLLDTASDEAIEGAAYLGRATDGRL